MIKIAICDDSKSDIGAMLELMSRYKSARSNITLWTKTFLKGTELLELIKEGKRFDVLLIDVIMPEIDGINLARLIRQYDDTVRVILLSGSFEYAEGAACVCDDYYLQKPIDEKDFFEVMDKMFSLEGLVSWKR